MCFYGVKMSQKMPRKLQADPIIDAVIEVRLKASKPLSDVLPGVLMQKMGEGVGDIERLPVADVPKQLRDNNPNLIYEHLVRVDLQGYSLLVGDRSVTLACLMPYPGGVVFKKKAIEVFATILELPIIEEVTRFSIKYTDFIKEDQVAEMLKYLDLDIKAGAQSLDNFQGFTLQFSTKETDITSLVKVILPANVQFNQDPSKRGMILEVDSIQMLDQQSVAEFGNQFSNLLDGLHLNNKEQFFALLTPYALEKLGATDAH